MSSRTKLLIATGFAGVAAWAGVAFMGSAGSQVSSPPSGFDLERPYDAEIVETHRSAGEVTKQLRHEVHFVDSENYDVTSTKEVGDDFDVTDEVRRPGSYRRISPDAYYDVADVVPDADEQARLSDELGPDAAGAAVQELARSGQMQRHDGVWADEKDVEAGARPVPQAAGTVLGIKRDPASNNPTDLKLVYQRNGDVTVGMVSDGPWSLTITIDAEGRPLKATEVVERGREITYEFERFSYSTPAT